MKLCKITSLCIALCCSMPAFAQDSSEAAEQAEATLEQSLTVEDTSTSNSDVLEAMEKLTEICADRGLSLRDCTKGIEIRPKPLVDDSAGPMPSRDYLRQIVREEIAALALSAPAANPQASMSFMRGQFGVVNPLMGSDYRFATTNGTPVKCLMTPNGCVPIIECPTSDPECLEWCPRCNLLEKGGNPTGSGLPDFDPNSINLEMALRAALEEQGYFTQDADPSRFPPELLPYIRGVQDGLALSRGK